jgi:RNA 2',3'-cyclic 3'-phosphodiesterase
VSRQPRQPGGPQPRDSGPPQSPRLRLFVAADLPAQVRAALATFRDAADPATWRPVPDDALHVTLAFLGHLPEETAETAAAVLDGAAGPAPRLAVAGPLLLPPRRGRVLCAALSDSDGELAALQARVSDGLEAAGLYTPEKRPFRAHATVARLRSGARSPRALPDGLAPEPLEFHAEAVTVYRSHLGRGGASYEPLHRVALRP